MYSVFINNGIASLPTLRHHHLVALIKDQVKAMQVQLCHVTFSNIHFFLRSR